jgi:hypothetical protein
MGFRTSRGREQLPSPSRGGAAATVRARGATMGVTVRASVEQFRASRGREHLPSAGRGGAAATVRARCVTTGESP